ncbi:MULTISPECIES: hypothetical protein [Sphingobacterium]|uniref:hypothetical protein n=1 Tax=Sphingobacterium TaxID=28453 RepID=UPI00257E9D46|nr:MULTISPECIES: hypothetical protein [Sphingobacterium]
MKENSTYHDGLEFNHLPESLRKNPFAVPENYFSDLESKIIGRVKWMECKDESVFEVPEGYFDSLPDLVLSKIAEDSLKNKVTLEGFTIPEQYAAILTEDIFHRISEENLKEKIQSDGFTVPTGYFQTLEQNITTTLAETELKDIVATDGFAVPVNYQLDLEAAILARITEEKLKEAVPTEGFEVPVNYHSDLEATILARVTEEKLKDAIPAAGFDIPSHYFDNLSDKIIGAIQEAEQERDSTPIHHLGKPKKWYARYAVAASFTAMLGLGGYWGYQYQQQNAFAQEQDNLAEEQLSQHLSEIPKQEIINYLSASASGDDIIYMSQYTDETNLPTKGFGTNISKQEIEDYLNYTL